MKKATCGIFWKVPRVPTWSARDNLNSISRIWGQFSQVTAPEEITAPNKTCKATNSWFIIETQAFRLKCEGLQIAKSQGKVSQQNFKATNSWFIRKAQDFKIKCDKLQIAETQGVRKEASSTIIQEIKLQIADTEPSWIGRQYWWILGFRITVKPQDASTFTPGHGSSPWI